MAAATIWRPKPTISFQRLSRIKATGSSRLMERAMGIEPTSEAWEACNLTQEALDLRHFFDFRKALIGK